MAFSISVTPASVTVGGSFTVRTAGRDGKSVTLTVRRGGSAVDSDILPHDLQQPGESDEVSFVTARAEWLDGCATASASFTLTAVRSDGVSAAAVTVTVSASEAMRRPVVGALSLQPVQPQGVPAAWADSYIANLTQARVAAEVTPRFPGSGETVSAVVLSYPGGASVAASYDSASGKYVALSPPVTGDTVFTLTATDSRGKQASGSVSLTGVIPYTPPTVELRELYRCDSGGTAQEGGAYYKIRVEAVIYTGLSGNSLRRLTAGLRNQTAANLTSGTAAVLGGALSLNSAYTVVVTVQDQISGEVQRAFQLAGRLRDFVLRRGSGVTHLGIGTTPANVSGHTTIQLPAGGQLLIDGVDVLAALEARIAALEA